MTVVSLTTIALACVLSYFRFEETFTSLAVQRLQLTAQEVARVLQAGLDLGLPVESQETIPEVLRQQLADHGDVASITIGSCEGQVLFHEGLRAGDGRDVIGRAVKPSWSSRDADRLSVGLRVSDALGGCAAGVVISRTAEPLRLAMASVARRYAVLGAAASAATLLAMVAAALLFSQTRPTIARIDDDLDDLLDGREASENADFPAVVARQQWEAELAEAYTAARPTLVRIARQHRQVSS